MNLSGQTIRFTGIPAEGSIVLTLQPSSIQFNNTHYLSGVSVEFLQCIQMILGFTGTSFRFAEEFFLRDPNVEDIALPNNSIGHLLETNNSDVALPYFYFYPSRLLKANPLLPSGDEKFKLYFVQPKFQNSVNPFTQQFSPEVALAFMGILSVSVILLMGLLQRQLNDYKPSYKHFYDALIWAIGTWCQQGPTLHTSKWQGVAVMIVINLFCIFLYFIYCALIIATLTRESLPVKSIEDLIRFKYTFFAYGDTKDGMIVGNLEKLIWHPPRIHTNVKDLVEYEKVLSIQRMVNGHHPHAHLDSDDNFFIDFHRTMLQYYDGSDPNLPRDICRTLSTVPYAGSSIQSGMFARKGFPHRNEFNYALSKIRESGVNKRLALTFERGRAQATCQISTNSGMTYQANLGMKYLGTMFSGLAASYTATILLLLIEYTLSHLTIYLKSI